MHHQPKVRPVIESNAAYLNGSSHKPKLFIPNPIYVLAFITVFSLVFVVALFVLLKPVYDGYRLDRNGLRVNGEVVSVESYSVKNGKLYRVTYSFKDTGGFRMATDEGLRAVEVHGLSKGSPVPIVYLKTNGSVSSLGVPGKLWGQRGSTSYVLTSLLCLPVAGYGLWQFVASAREHTLQSRLFKEGKVMEAETVSTDWTENQKGHVETVVTYRVPLQDGSVLGTAKYSTKGHSQVRRPRAGEKIPILFIDEQNHRPI